MEPARTNLLKLRHGRVIHKLRNAQPGAAAAKPSRRHHCAGCRNSAVARRAEKSDFVAKWGDASGISGRKVRRQKSRSTRWSAISARIIQYYTRLQRPHSGDKLSKLAVWKSSQIRSISHY